jgi:hypothetical protein
MRAIVEAAQPITGRGVGYKLFTRGLIASMARSEMQRVYRRLKDARERGIIRGNGSRRDPRRHGAESRLQRLSVAVWLRAANELVMVFEDGFVAIIPSDQVV